MTNLYQHGSGRTARAFVARVVLVAVGISVGVLPVAFASTAAPSRDVQVASGQTVVHGLKRAPRYSPLPSVFQDDSQVTLPLGISLSRAQGWLSRVIAVRESALRSLSGPLIANPVIQPSDRAQLTTLIDTSLATLDAISSEVSGDTSVNAVRRQSLEVMNLEVLGVRMSQVHLLERVDVLVGLADQLSAKESSAAAAIAISHATAATLRAEQTMDHTVKSLAQTISSELGSTQTALLALPGTPLMNVAAFSNAKLVLSTASAQLRLANTDLRELVIQLVGH